MTIDITSFGHNPDTKLEQPTSGGVIDITPEEFNRPSEELGEIEEDVEDEIEETEEIEITKQPSEEQIDTEEETEIETEEEDTEEEEEVEESSEEDSIREYFNQATALNVLQVPEDFEWDEEDPYGSIEKVANYTNQKLLERVENGFYSKIQDPILREVVNLAIEGGNFLDVNNLINQTNSIVSYESMDISDEDDAVKLYSDYLKSTTKFKDNKIKKLVDIAKEDNEIEELAEEAQQYFLEDIRKKREQEVELAKAQRTEYEQKTKEYWSSFYETLNEKKLDDEMKAVVQSSFQIVNEDTQPILKYQHAFNQIAETPEHFIDFLLFINSYNPEKGFDFEREVKKESTKKTNSFKEKLEKVITSNTKGKSSSKKSKKIIPKVNRNIKNIRRY